MKTKIAEILVSNSGGTLLVGCSYQALIKGSTTKFGEIQTWSNDPILHVIKATNLEDLKHHITPANRHAVVRWFNDNINNLNLLKDK